MESLLLKRETVRRPQSIGRGRIKKDPDAVRRGIAGKPDRNLAGTKKHMEKSYGEIIWSFSLFHNATCITGGP